MRVVTDSNVDPSLNQRRKSKRKLPADAKTARRAIIRDGTGGEYSTNVPNPEDTPWRDLVLDQQLQMNALMLTLGELSRTVNDLVRGTPTKPVKMSDAIRVASETGAATPESNVVPMRSDAKVAEQEPSDDVVYGPHPLPTPPPVASSPAHQVQAAYQAHLRMGGTHIKAQGYPLPTPAANDDVYVDKDSARTSATAEVLATEVLGKTNLLSDTAFAKLINRKFGFGIAESYRIIQKEHRRRDKASLKKHGMTYVDLCIKRYEQKRDAVGYINSRGVRINDRFIPAPAIGYGFKSWSSYVDSPEFAHIQAVRLQRDEGPAIREQRRQAQVKAKMKSSNSIVGVRERLRTSANRIQLDKTAASTTPIFYFSGMTARFRQSMSSDWKATKMGWRDSIDRITSMLGMGRRDWFSEERALYEHDSDPNEYNRRYPTLARNLRRPDYIPRIVHDRGPLWFALEPLNDYDHMTTISHELIKRGVYTPLDVIAMQGHLAAYAGTLVAPPVAVTKD